MLTADFTMIMMYCLIFTESQFLGSFSLIIADIMRVIGCCPLGVYIPLWEFAYMYMWFLLWEDHYLKAMDTIGNYSK